MSNELMTRYEKAHAQELIIEKAKLLKPLRSTENVRLTIMDGYAWHILGEGWVKLNDEVKSGLIRTLEADIVKLAEYLAEMELPEDRVDGSTEDDAEIEDERAA